jgi:hypothetical protein
MQIGYGEGENKGSIFTKQDGRVLLGSNFVINLGDGPILDNKTDKIDYLEGDINQKGYWGLGNGKVTMDGQTLGGFEDFGFGNVCFSNYWHNSVIAVRDPAAFKRAFGYAACEDGVYANCHKAPVNWDKVPDLTITFLDNNDTYDQSKDYKGYTITIPAKEYVFTTKNKGKSDIFQTLLIGDLRLATRSNSCPMSSKLGIGNLFHMNRAVNYVQSEETSKEGVVTNTWKIGIVGLTAVDIEGKKLKDAVVWVGVLTVVVFFIAIMILKSMSKPLEKVEDLGAPHATIGNDADDENYAKPTDDGSD